MSDKAPAVSVLVPVWGSMPYVIRTVEAILAQSFTDFELLILDDKGPDDSITHLKKYASDPRVRMIDNGTNRGFGGCMNHGLGHARGEFIAAMDADDTAFPNRLQVQYDYMRAHPEVGLVGSAAVHINPTDGVIAPHRQPLADIVIRFQQLFMPAMYQPSTFARRDIIERHKVRYDPAIPLADDFDFWCQMGRHAKLANLAEPLVYYRVHPNSLSKQKKELCDTRKLEVVDRNLRAVGLAPDAIARVKRVIPWLMDPAPLSADELRELWQVLAETLTAFCTAEKLSAAPWALKATVGKWMIKALLHSASPVGGLLKFFLRHPVYALAGGLHIAELLLWQAKWRIMSS